MAAKRAKLVELNEEDVSGVELDDMELFLAAMEQPLSEDESEGEVDVKTEHHWYLMSDSGTVALLADAERTVEQQSLLGTMHLVAAQDTAIVRLPQLLTRQEVAAALTWCDATHDHCGFGGNHTGWRTQFVHTGGLFAREQPSLRRKILAAALAADRAQGWGLLSGLDAPLGTSNTSGQVPHFRCVELVTVQPGGSLADPRHYDQGSLVTVDIMLSQPAASRGEPSEAEPPLSSFTGGRLQFLETTADGVREELHTRPHEEFAVGDALVFVSHKFHSVTPVETGTRRVLVAEVWAGPECSCAHRCSSSTGAAAVANAGVAPASLCDFDLAAFKEQEQSIVDA